MKSRTRHLLKSLSLLIFIIGGLMSFHAYGQLDCERDKIIGEWRYVKSMFGVYTNIDSLREVMKQAKDTIGIWNLKLDGTYSFKVIHSTKQYKVYPFTFDSTKCEIILGKKKGKNRFNLEIIYLDSHFLVYKSDNNPKGYNTYLLARE